MNKIHTTIAFLSTIYGIATYNEALTISALIFWFGWSIFKFLDTIADMIESKKMDNNLKDLEKAISAQIEKDLKAKQARSLDRQVPDTKTEKRILKVKKG
jgi:hypothetical protein